jgi:tRNA G46 methylase TrmB
MEKKQTAVDLLVNILNKEGFAPVLTDEEIQQAKQMEKDQMKEATLNNVTTNEELRKIFKNQFEEYYNKTYGGQQC